jgi:hypothetical protein
MRTFDWKVYDQSYTVSEPNIWRLFLEADVINKPPTIIEIDVLELIGRFSLFTVDTRQPLSRSSTTQNFESILKAAKYAKKQP